MNDLFPRKIVGERLPDWSDTEEHLLVQDDASHLRALAHDSVDLTVTSPPYNVGLGYENDADDMSYAEYRRFSRRWLGCVLRWTRDTGRLCVNVALDTNRNGKQALAADLTQDAVKAGWSYHGTILWLDGTLSKGTAWGSWMSASAPHVITPAEVVLVFYKGGWKRKRPGVSDVTADEFKDWVRGTWSFHAENSKLRKEHPAPFPRELARRCIKLFSFVGDRVLDPFCGSGTTMVEAIENARVAWGIEREPRYCALIHRRIMQSCRIDLTSSPSQGETRPRTPGRWCWTAQAR